MYKTALVLFIVTVIAGGALGGLNAATKEPIRAQEIKTLNESMRSIFPDAADFAELPIPDDDGYVTACFEALATGGGTAGYIIETKTKGYGGDVTLLTGVDAGGAVAGTKISSHAETPGLGANAEKPAFSSQFLGLTGTGGGVQVVKMNPGENEVEAITSATITSNAVTNGVNAALDYFSNILN